MSDDKSQGPSRSFEVIKLSEQINRYIFKGDDCARVEQVHEVSSRSQIWKIRVGLGVELLNQVINGEELTEALAYLKSEIAENYKQKIRKKENGEIKEIIGYLEEIVKGKEGTIIKEIRGRVLDRYIKLKK